MKPQTTTKKIQNNKFRFNIIPLTTRTSNLRLVLESFEAG